MTKNDVSWKEAVIEACVVSNLDWDEDDPQVTINRLLEWESEMALSPLISSNARDLILKGALCMRDHLISILRSADSNIRPHQLAETLALVLPYDVPALSDVLQNDPDSIPPDDF